MAAHAARGRRGWRGGSGDDEIGWCAVVLGASGSWVTLLLGLEGAEPLKARFDFCEHGLLAASLVDSAQHGDGASVNAVESPDWEVPANDCHNGEHRSDDCGEELTLS